MRMLKLIPALLLALFFENALAKGPEARLSAPVSAVDSVSIAVSDMDRSLQFYTQVLTFEKVADREVAGEAYERLFGVFGLRLRAVRLRLGDEEIELMQFLAPRGRAFPADSHSNDRWFQHIAIVVSDMSAAYARLRSFNVEHASSEPQRLPDWNTNAAGIQAFYFRDPDQHYLEVINFPADKGLARWHRRGAPLFLGIDHTAIVVADTESSIHYYRDLLGLRVVGTSENYGTEQEHLNAVFGAHLRITSLRAERGPGVELLEYLAPRTGRPLPQDTQANDLWYWQVNMRTPSRSIPGGLREQGVELLAPDLVRLPETSLGWVAAVRAHDPDGHTTLLSASER